jgi:8-oxo-dGTP pyrophosphatase MutT (NUDIX family)
MRTIQEILAAYQARPLSAEGARCAAVLVPLRPRADNAGALEVLLTRRTTDLLSHAGQVSFPGGSIEAADPDPTAAALREMHEELGVPPSRVEVIGRLDDMVTITGYHIVPIVGLVDPEASLAPSPQEVARVFTVPLAELLAPERWLQRIYTYRGSPLEVWHFPFDGEDVWGVTARMLRGLVELLWREYRPSAALERPEVGA